jgi:hypothetical protein
MKRFALEKGFYAYFCYYVVVFAWVFSALLLAIIVLEAYMTEKPTNLFKNIALLLILMNIPALIKGGTIGSVFRKVWIYLAGFYFTTVIVCIISGISFNSYILLIMLVIFISLISEIPLFLFSELDDRWSQLKAKPANKAAS